MFVQPRSLSVALGASILALLSGCASFSKKDNGVRQVDNLVSRVGRAHLEAEVSKDRVRMALGDLQAIVDDDFSGDPIAAFEEYVEAVERSEKQADALLRTVGPMKKAASGVFDQWDADLLTFSSPEFRNKSRARLDQTRRRFQRVLDSLEHAGTAYQTYNLGLRDHATFLSNDYNTQAIRGLRKQVRALSSWGQEVDRRLDAVLVTCEEYVDAAAPPGSFAESGSQEPQVASSRGN